MKNKTVTVIVPAYNAERTIEKCLRSVLNQSYHELEIIVVDDGSTDKTYSICKSIESNDDRLKVIRQVNAGPSAARNKGIDLSTGNYLMFVDSDDWIDQDNIENAVARAEQTCADIVLWNLCFEENGRSKINSPLLGDNRIFNKNDLNNLMFLLLTYVSENRNMSNLSITGPVCKLFRREVVGKNRFPVNQRLGEDLVFLMDISENIKKMLYINKCYYHVSVRNDSLSHGFNTKYSSWKADFVNAVMIRIKNNNLLKMAGDKFIFYNYLTVVEQCLFFSGNLNYCEKRKCIFEFLHGIEYKINYRKISHKCALFLKYRLFLPVYIIGIISRKYSKK